MEKLQFKLDAFEGPLDLLLYLISKHKLDIYDIEISELLRQYMAVMDAADTTDLDAASEFFEMASRLIYIKSAALLPKHEEADELKRELTGQLLEYQAARRAAEKLAEKGRNFKVYVREPVEIPLDNTYRRLHPPEKILDAYLGAVGKAKRRLPPPASAFSGIVTKRVVSVTSRILFVLKRLHKKQQSDYLGFFESLDRSELVATFLAMLELIKAKRITVSDDNRTVYYKSKLEK